MARRRPSQKLLHDEPPELIRYCKSCEGGDHEACPGTVMEAWGQYASCACDCGGGLEAWREGL